MTNGLQGQWAQEHTSWRQGLDEAFQEFASQRVKILVWGLGEGWTDYFAKRQQLIQHLQTQHPGNEVVTSEQLMRLDSRFANLHLHDAEELQVYIADVVIVLVVKDKRVTGVQGEIAIFRNNANFQRKAWLLTPRLTRREQRDAGFLQQGWVGYHRDRRLDYTPEQYAECTTMREYCAEAVQVVRNQLAFEELRARYR